MSMPIKMLVGFLLGSTAGHFLGWWGLPLALAVGILLSLIPTS